MKVRFEIFKSFIRVDLQLQLEVEVAFTKEKRVFKSVFKQDKSQFKKKRAGVCLARPGTRLYLFFNLPSSCLKNASKLVFCRGSCNNRFEQGLAFHALVSEDGSYLGIEKRACEVACTEAVGEGTDAPHEVQYVKSCGAPRTCP